MNEGTLKVTPITDKQPQPACRFSITATLDGFPITIEGETGNASNLRALVDRLKAIGATPPRHGSVRLFPAPDRRVFRPPGGAG
jgi:hypothetical protein